MSPRPLHEGNAHFLARAQYFAIREIERWDQGSAQLTMPVTWLAYYLLYRAGLTAEEIAQLAEVGRRHIARRLLICMALFKAEPIRSRIEALVAEMGRARWNEGSAVMLRFPGPSHLSAIEIEAIK